MEPKLWEPQHLDHLVEQLERSTESYLLSYQQFLDDADEMDPKKHEEEANHEDFMHLIESAQITLCHMREQTNALQLMEVLSHDIKDWEDIDVDHLKGTLDASWSKLQEDLEALKLSTFTSGGKQLPELRQLHKDFRRRLSKCGCSHLKNLSLWTSLPTRKETQIITAQQEDFISFLCLPTTEIS